MSEHRYTELFFLDEAVAFAAGHRPCAECRRERFEAFKDAWQRAQGKDAKRPFADEMDLELHPARIDKQRKKVVCQAALSSLPDGCFIQLDGSAYLVWQNALRLWTPQGYTSSESRPRDLIVAVLTPEPIVRCFREGYKPEVLVRI
jgi:hypothetical protein